MRTQRELMVAATKKLRRCLKKGRRLQYLEPVAGTPAVVRQAAAEKWATDGR